MNIFKFKIVIIGIMILMLLIPVYMVSSLVDERKERYEELMEQMGKAWGKPKSLYAVFLSDNNSYFAPSDVNITGVVKAELRKKGIFRIPFYSADLKIRATFADEAVNSGIANINILLSDINAVDITGIRWSGRQIKVRKEANLLFGDIPVISIGLPVDENKEGNNEFELSVKLLGIDRLHFMQFAKKTEISIDSNWKDPNFSGAYLPVSREITSDGFQAEWELFNPLLISKGNSFSIETNETFGVSFFVPVNIYSLTDRAVKYAVLFIALTFLSFFIFESMNGIRIHPVQYLMVGFALIIFYLLLLSLSEHINFAVSYIISSLATIGLITLYSIKVLDEKRRSVVMASLLLILYVLLYVLLNLEDYSLLFGSVAMFIILTLVMYVTRNINWYEIQEKFGSRALKQED